MRFRFWRKRRPTITTPTITTTTTDDVAFADWFCKVEADFERPWWRPAAFFRRKR